jgi:hypothetical protein
MKNFSRFLQIILISCFILPFQKCSGPFNKQTEESVVEAIEMPHSAHVAGTEIPTTSLIRQDPSQNTNAPQSVSNDTVEGSAFEQYYMHVLEFVSPQFRKGEATFSGFTFVFGTFDNVSVPAIALQLCFALIVASLIFSFRQNPEMRRWIFPLGILELICLAIFYFGVERYVMWGFWTTVAICFLNTILSRFIYKKLYSDLEI